MTVFLSSKLDNIPWILAAIAVGSAIAAPVARRVQMTQMPQLVALFNGVGGGAAALVALLELAHTDDPWVRVAIVFTLLVGAISFSGSLVTFAKLQELMTTRPVVFPGLPRDHGRWSCSPRSPRPPPWSSPAPAGSRSCCSRSASRPACCSCCPSAAPTCRS